MARTMQPLQLWESLCTDLSYGADLKAAGAELLTRLQSTDKLLGEGTQVCARALKTPGNIRSVPPYARAALRVANSRPISHLASGCAACAQATIQGQLAAAAYLASSKGKLTPGVSVTQLTSYFSMHMKARAPPRRHAATRRRCPPR